MPSAAHLIPILVSVSLKRLKQHKRRGRGPLKGAISYFKALQVCKIESRDMLEGRKDYIMFPDKWLLICPPGKSMIFSKKQTEIN